jgi:hypothetical protein
MVHVLARGSGFPDVAGAGVGNNNQDARTIASRVPSSVQRKSEDFF